MVQWEDNISKPNENESHSLKNFPLPTSQLTHGNKIDKKQNKTKNYNDSSAGTFEPAGTQIIDFN